MFTIAVFLDVQFFFSIADKIELLVREKKGDKLPFPTLIRVKPC